MRCPPQSSSLPGLAGHHPIFLPDIDLHRATADLAVIIEDRGQLITCGCRNFETLETGRASNLDKFHLARIPLKSRLSKLTSEFDR